MSILNEILHRALELPQAERAALAHRLLLSLEPDDFDADSDEAWRLEVEARLAMVDRGSAKVSDWSEALTRMRQALSSGGPP